MRCIVASLASGGVVNASSITVEGDYRHIENWDDEYSVQQYDLECGHLMQNWTKLKSLDAFALLDPDYWFDGQRQSAYMQCNQYGRDHD